MAANKPRSTKKNNETVIEFVQSGTEIDDKQDAGQLDSDGVTDSRVMKLRAGIGIDDDEMVFGDGEYLGMLADLGGIENQVSIKIYQRSRESRQMSFLFEVDPIEYPSFTRLHTFCRTEFGGGIYQLRVYATGRKGVQFVKNFEVIESESQKRERLSSNFIHANAGQAGPAADIVNTAIAQANRQQDTLMQVFQKMQEQANAKPKTDIVDTLVKLAGAVAPFLPFILKAWPQRVDPVEQLKNTAEVLRALRDDNGGGGGDDISMTGVLGKFIDKMGPTIAAAATRQMEQPAQHKQPAPQRMIGSPTPVEMRAKPSEEKEMLYANDKQLQSNVNTKLGLILAMCVVAAKLEAEPMTYAIMIFDQLDDAELEELGRHIDDPMLLTGLAAIEPKIVDYQDWFAMLILHLVDMFGVDDGLGEGGEKLTEDHDSAIPPGSDGESSNNNANSKQHGDGGAGSGE